MKKGLFKIFILVVFLEIFIFNYQSYRVLSSNKKKEFDKRDFSSYEIDDNSTYIVIDNIFEEVKTLHLSLTNGNNLKYQFFYTDETSSEFRSLPSKQYINNFEKSKYIPTYLSGKSKKIAVKIFSNDVNVDKIVLNDKIPFRFSFARFFIILILFWFVYITRKCKIFKSVYSKKSLTQEIILSLITFSFIVVTGYINLHCLNYLEYDNYTVSFVKSLIDGKVSLETEPSEKLKNLDNPYDTIRKKCK